MHCPDGLWHVLQHLGAQDCVKRVIRNGNVNDIRLVVETGILVPEFRGLAEIMGFVLAVPKKFPVPSSTCANVQHT